ncbi:MAG TPA: hypothetical protein VEF76_09920 [Patescibacteria group bacterium]|nr:hypothetical protein [Patescibacteria group bacterium]
MSSLGYYDEEKIRAIVTASEKRMKTEFDAAAKRDRQIAEAMGGIAAALKELTGEIKALRADLNPEMDKPVKLAPPKQGG